jgi:hypothetical protein
MPYIDSLAYVLRQIGMYKAYQFHFGILLHRCLKTGPDPSASHCFHQITAFKEKGISGFSKFLF